MNSLFPRKIGKIFLLLCVLLFAGLLVPAGMAADFSTSISSSAEAVIVLDGPWEFVWGEFLLPGFDSSDVPTLKSVNVPRSWNQLQVNGMAVGSDGFATYRWLGRWEGDSGILGLRLPRIFTSYRMFVNGMEMTSVGMVSREPEQARPGYLPQTVLVPLDPGPVEIVFHVANFSHRSGGLLYSIEAGPASVVTARERGSLAYELMLFGSLLVMGLYHLAVYYFRSRERSFLYFGLFCTLVSLRTLLVGEMFLLHMVPNVPWEWMHRMQTLTYYFGVGVIMKFFLHAFPKQVNGTIVQGVNILTGLFAAVVLVLPPRLFTLINPGFQVLTLLVIGYMLYIFSRVVRQRELGAILTAAGAMFLIAAVVNDMLYLNILRADNGLVLAVIERDNFSSLGLLLFVLAQSLVLSLRYTNALEEAASAQDQLRRLNEDLEEIVAERTSDLEQSRDALAEQKMQLQAANASLAKLSTTDPLTGLANRRCFDETLEREWRRAARQQVSLTVLFLDIDDFKQINDTYGHSEGDKCLQTVADVLRANLRRSEDLAGRYGGEEFVVLLPNMSAAEGVALGNTIRSEIAAKQTTLGEQETVAITVSVGAAALVPSAQQSSQTIIQRADQAMYRAKDQGKNQVQT